MEHGNLIQNKYWYHIKELGFDNNDNGNLFNYIDDELDAPNCDDNDPEIGKIEAVITHSEPEYIIDTNHECTDNGYHGLHCITNDKLS